jgi:hypothetical protein
MLYHKERELEKARLELEQEKKNVQFKMIDNASSQARGTAYKEPEDDELNLLPLIGRLLKKLFF